MNKDDHISEEHLNAFVDDELDGEERSRVFDQAEQNPELEQRLCQQRKLGELVRHAYQDVPEPRRAFSEQQRRGPLARALVASVLILVGLGAGLVAHQQLDQQAALATAETNSHRFLLHVTSGETSQMRKALQQARDWVEAGTAQQPNLVEVVANEQGLNLLRSDITPFADEISVLAAHDVVFYACSRAIQRLQERGVEVHLVPEANPDHTALDRVVQRMQEDWNYIRL